MTAKFYVYSTLTNGQNYTIYQTGGADIKVPTQSVHIKGGNNIADKKTLLTPKGVVTEITEAQYELLKKCRSFNNHVQSGFIQVEEKKVDPEVVAADMDSRDGSAPLVPEDFTDDEATVTTNKDETKKKPGRKTKKT